MCVCVRTHSIRLYFFIIIFFSVLLLLFLLIGFGVSYLHERIETTKNFFTLSLEYEFKRNKRTTTNRRQSETNRNEKETERYNTEDTFIVWVSAF